MMTKFKWFYFSEYFCNDQNPHNEVLMQALKRLQSDKDRDVKYYATLKPTNPRRLSTPSVQASEVSCTPHCQYTTGNYI